jgi:hypothetical protein
MLTFELKLDASEDVNSYSFGYISIFGKDGIITTNHENKFMLLMSLPDLLDGIRNLLNRNEVNKFEFVGIDSSFRFYIVKADRNFLIQDQYGRNIDLVSRSELISSCLLGLCDYASHQLSMLNFTEIVFDDLNSAVLDFKASFNEQV